MPFQLFTNNAKSTLSVAVSSNTQASLTLQSGHGARFPTPQAPDYFHVTLDDGVNVEICKCIAISGDVLTVLRGYEGTTAQASFATGTKCELRLTAFAQQRNPVRWTFDTKYIKPAANVTSWHVMGATLPTVVNSQIAGTLTNSSAREQNERIRLTQANSAQNPIEWRLAQPTVVVANGFRYSQRFGFAIVPNSSHWFMGLVNTTGAVTSVFPPSSLQNGIVVGWANAGSLQGTNLSIWRANSASPAVQLDLGSYFNVNTQAWYEVEFTADPNNTRIDYTVRRLDVSSIADASSFFTTSIPGNSLWLSPYMHGSTMVTSGMAVELGGAVWRS
jgi:hypothetical protein